MTSSFVDETFQYEFHKKTHKGSMLDLPQECSANTNHLQKDHHYQYICIVGSWSDTMSKEKKVQNNEIYYDLEVNSKAMQLDMTYPNVIAINDNLYFMIARDLEILSVSHKNRDAS